MFVAYIGRDVTSEEQDAIESKKENDEPLDLDYENSPIKLDGFCVAYEDLYEEYVVCQHYIGMVTSDDFNQLLYDGIDYTKFPKPHDSRYKLRIRNLGS